VSEIVNSIVANQSYKNLCKKIAKTDIANDLYQEFILAVLEAKTEKLEKAFNGKYLNVYCVGIIYNLWSMRNRRKAYKNGKTSNLHQLTDWGINLDGLNDPTNEDSNNENDKYERRFFQDLFSEDPDDNLDENFSIVKEEIERCMNSTDKTTHYDAHVLFNSFLYYKNPREFSRETGIEYMAVRQSIQRISNKIKLAI